MLVPGQTLSAKVRSRITASLRVVGRRGAGANPLGLFQSREPIPYFADACHRKKVVILEPSNSAVAIDDNDGSPRDPFVSDIYAEFLPRSTSCRQEMAWHSVEGAVAGADRTRSCVAPCPENCQGNVRL